MEISQSCQEIEKIDRRSEREGGRGRERSAYERKRRRKEKDTVA